MAVDRLHLSENVVPDRALLVVGDVGARGRPKEPGKLQEIVGAARLAGDARQEIALPVRAAKCLFRRHASRRIHVVFDHFVPEPLGRVFLPFFLFSC